MDDERRLTRLEFLGGNAVESSMVQAETITDHEINIPTKKRRRVTEKDSTALSPANRRKPPRLPLIIRTAAPDLEPYVEYQGRYTSHYTLCFQLELCGMYDVVQEKAAPKTLKMICTRQRAVLEKDLQFLKQLRQSACFVKCLGSFHQSATVDFVYEYLDLNLNHISALSSSLSNLQFAAVAGQIIEALRHIEDSQLSYGRLSLSSVFLTRSGVLKLGEVELCKYSTDAQRSKHDVQALGTIITTLSTKASTSQLHTYRGSVSEKVMDFAGCAIAPDATLSSLAEHDLVIEGWNASDLEPLAALAAVSCYREYDNTVNSFS